MKKFCWGICFVMMLGLAGQGKAQETPPPYDDDVIMIYYEDENPQGLDSYLIWHNICLEAVLRLNPSLDINNVPYGTKLYLSTNKPCYVWSGSQNYYYSGWADTRLKFYENGHWLDEPYYSKDVKYTHGETTQQIASAFNVCLDNLLADNYLLAYHFDAYKQYIRNSMDIFISPYFPPCYPYITNNQIVTNNEVGVATTNGTTVDIKGQIASPLYFSKQVYHICVEEIMTRSLLDLFYNDYSRQNNSASVTIPNDALPCYNEQGQRLKYYDENGERLDVPVYSELPVYIARAGETIQDVAIKTGSCLPDLMRLNQYPSMPLLVDIELFIPITTEPCDQTIYALFIYGIRIDPYTVKDIAVVTNTCPDTLIALNPFLAPNHSLNRIFNWQDNWILTSPDPCYQTYVTHKGESVYDIEKILNVCFEEFFFITNRRGSIEMINNYLVNNIPNDTTIIYFPLDVQPCYNDLGQRLYYHNQYQFGRRCSYNYQCGNQNTPSQILISIYTTMPVYALQKSDTVYSISKQFNICVDELLKTNIILRHIYYGSDYERSFPEKRPIFIPQTRPCYDEITGMPLIYEDENGNLLPEPQVADHLIYYGGWTGMMVNYYNVCINRIEDANANKYDERGNANYLGYIIPTDRPPCYDDNGQPTNYVCYSQPVNLEVDDVYANPAISVDVDGEYCYNRNDLNTKVGYIWYKGNPYKVVYYHGTILESRAFTAWCFGVSLYDIQVINADSEFLDMLPYYARGIPKPTRECYLENPDILAGEKIHTVWYGDTITSIAEEYGIPYPFISVANQLDVNNMIWVGQKLIIPASPQSDDMWWLAILWAFWGGVVIVFIRNVRSYLRQEKETNP